MKLKKKSPKIKKVKPHGHTWWHNHLDPKFGAWLREVCPKCAWCGNPGYMVVSHILPKGTYQGLRYDPVNVLPMHGNCHQFNWHQNPLDMGEWFARTYPERKAYLDEAKKIFVKRDIFYYQKVESALDAKDVKSLMTLYNSPVDSPTSLLTVK
jgi:5-methylcytosine-specific restriction endonuclease McrA